MTEIGKHAFELAVLLLKLLEAFAVCSLHAAVLGFPLVVRGMLTPYSRQTSATAFYFLQNPNGLTFRESRFLHCRLLEGSLPEISTIRWSYSRGRLQKLGRRWMVSERVMRPQVVGKNVGS